MPAPSRRGNGHRAYDEPHGGRHLREACELGLWHAALEAGEQDEVFLALAPACANQPFKPSL